jgi:hypothetical protein
MLPFIPARRAGRALLLVLAVAVGLPGVAAAQTSGKVTYSILKEGEPIGKETYVIERDGDHVSVQLTVDSVVHIMFLDFSYHHRRSESWNGDKLEQLVADTDDDGSKHHVAATAGNGGLTLTSDGKPLAVATDAYPLSMWRKAIVGHTTLFAVESNDPPYHVAIKDVGSEVLTVGGQKIDAEHYAMTGDVDRDLWYDANGMLAKVAFRRRGFAISIVRD